MTVAERARVKLECLRMIATLRLDRARMQLISGFVDSYLRLSAQEEERFSEELARIVPTEREQVMQIVTSWMEKGIEQGIERGIERGRTLEAFSLIVRQLERRIGPLDSPVRQQVQGLTLAALEQLSEALLDFAGPADLQQWLSGHPPHAGTTVAH